MTWGARMEDLYRLSGMGLRDFAGSIGQERETVRKWISGEFEPTITAAWFVSCASGVPIDALVSDDPIDHWEPCSATPGDSARESWSDMIEALRLACGSCSRAADMLGVSKSSVQKWAAGTKEPRVRTAAEIASLLGVSLHALLSGEVCTEAAAIVDRMRQAS